jgi:hypothetical protein
MRIFKKFMFKKIFIGQINGLATNFPLLITNRLTTNFPLLINNGSSTKLQFMISNGTSVVDLSN